MSNESVDQFNANHAAQIAAGTIRAKTYRVARELSNARGFGPEARELIRVKRIRDSGKTLVGDEDIDDVLQNVRDQDFEKVHTKLIGVINRKKRREAKAAKSYAAREAKLAAKREASAIEAKRLADLGFVLRHDRILPHSSDEVDGEKEPEIIARIVRQPQSAFAKKQADPTPVAAGLPIADFGLVAPAYWSPAKLAELNSVIAPQLLSEGYSFVSHTRTPPRSQATESGRAAAAADSATFPVLPVVTKKRFAKIKRELISAPDSDEESHVSQDE